MNMTQKFLATLAVAASAMVASAGTLYWQVEGENAGDTFDSATLYVSQNSDGSSATALATASTANGALRTDADGTYSDMMQTDISGYSGDNPAYYFFVEMANYNGATDPKRGQVYTYQDLVDSGYVATSPFDSPSLIAGGQGLNMGATGAVPEPTSGLLLLIGGSLLALRRRRR